MYEAIDVNLKSNENNRCSVRKSMISLQCETGVSAANISKVIYIVAGNGDKDIVFNEILSNITSYNMADACMK